MLGKRVNIQTTKPIIIKHKFNVNDPVFCTVENIKDAIILNRYVIKNENYYKIGNKKITKIFKEIQLIHR